MDEGRKCVLLIADAIRRAEEIMEEIGRCHSTNPSPQQTSSGMPPCGKRWKLSGGNIIGRERSDSEIMLIHTKLPPGHLYPQLTQLPTNYPDFLAAFRGGQTVDNNTYLSTGNAVQTHLYKAAIASGHLTTKGNPIQGEFLVDFFLTDEGAEHILTPQDKQYCKMAVELARKSIAENDGEPHPYVGAVVVKGGKVLATGYRGETGEGRHAEFCALKKINDDVDKHPFRKHMYLEL